MKRGLVLVAIAAVSLTAAVSAGAFTTPPAAVVHNVTICLSGRTLGSGDTGSNAVITPSDPIWLKFAWLTLERSQQRDLLKVQSGKFLIHQGSVSGPIVSSVKWGVGNEAYWTMPARSGGAWTTVAYMPFGALASGSYTLEAHLEVHGVIGDGVNAYGPGALLQVNCPLVVQ